MFIALTVILVVHAIAHTAGFAADWQLVSSVKPQVALFNGRVPISARGRRLMGVVWLVLAAAFLVCAVATQLHAHWAFTLLTTAALASLLMCIAERPAARLGIPVNLLLLGLAFYLGWVRWFAL